MGVTDTLTWSHNTDKDISKFATVGTTLHKVIVVLVLMSMYTDSAAYPKVPGKPRGELNPHDNLVEAFHESRENYKQCRMKIG